MELNYLLDKLINFDTKSCNAIIILRSLMKAGITGKELAILLTLVINRERHTTAEELAITIWNQSIDNDTKLYNAIIVTMKYLKDKLQTTKYEIVVKRNFGYILKKRGEEVAEQS